MDEREGGVIAAIEHWYLENCDGDWEHEYGLDITTMDNPGWDVKIDLGNTTLVGFELNEEFEGPRTSRQLLPANGYDAQYDWYRIWTEAGKFRAYCAPKRLGYVLARFLEHVQEAEQQLGELNPEEGR